MVKVSQRDRWDATQRILGEIQLCQSCSCKEVYYLILYLYLRRVTTRAEVTYVNLVIWPMFREFLEFNIIILHIYSFHSVKIILFI